MKMAEKAVFLQIPTNKTIDIEFDNIVYTAKNHREKKVILRGVSGKFKSGELTAIMGPSGAGKTSLLNILTGFQLDGIKGTITSTGGAQDKSGAKQYKKQSCYILQDDHLAPFFTVMETMNMAADLKLGHISDKEKQFLIDDILETLSLSTAKATRCCDLSGGQKKRLSVALELIDNPPVMFLDEPTTGLDSLSSSQCVSMLKNLARGGRTIICTIHQPSATIFEMFDHVYVLAEGKCIYQGASLNVVNYLSTSGLNCPRFHNPADYLLEVANGEYGNFTDVLAQRAREENWRTPQLELNGKKDTVEYRLIEPFEKNLNTTAPSEWFRFSILVNRAFIQLYRDWTISHIKIALHLFVGIVLGLTYYKMGNDASKTTTNVGYYIISSVYLAYTSLMPAVLKFPSELAVLKKERFNNWYNLKTYYFAFLVTDIPMQILFSFVYTTTSYFLSEQPYDPFRFIMVLAILILVCLTSSSLGLLIGTTANPVNGTFFGAIITAFFLVVAGFLILFNHMNRPMYYISFISYLSYSYAGLIQAVYGFGRSPIPCPETVEYCHLKVPDFILKELGLDQCNYWADVTFLFANFVVLRILAYCALKRRLKTG